ncbi:type IV pilus assembly protein PilC [Zhongshania antarctica]|jgi:type IV pilus assembly protein PilC|uniref:Type IV pilus assembly protein PilC n=1 Tax=Zhongshania antarctica TaxID=641702 RepID=A0A840R6H8_9GAMM|nr:type II secretion system F family protein [Zhongshania antarctica]MBB5188093.1 type IV pilus assembly protein PilC [Zhongshania antarctica]
MAAAKTDTFVWQGVDKQGRKTRGELNAPSSAIVKAHLRKQGIAAKNVKKKAKPLFSSKKAIKPADIAIFTRQMATMLKAGVPLVQSFDIVAEGVENPTMQELVTDIKNEVASGGGFAVACSKHPKYFDDLFCSLIASGESSGTLELMLDRVATYKEKTEALKAKIKKALTYPIAVIVVAVVVTSILLIKVVPQFAATFENFGSDLPAFTKMVVSMSEWMQANWYILLGAAVIFSAAFGKAREKSKPFSDWVDKMMLKIPVVGDIVFNSVIARFSRTLATTFGAGVPLVDALNSVAGAAGNAVYSKAIIQIRDDVTTGQTLYSSIKFTNLFPSMLLQMVSIGEESGSLDDMLDKVANHYEDAVDNAVDTLTSLLEPFIMSILGVMVGGLMIAMYLPIFMLGSAI